jgi:hypothetical protein
MRLKPIHFPIDPRWSQYPELKNGSAGGCFFVQHGEETIYEAEDLQEYPENAFLAGLELGMRLAKERK